MTILILEIVTQVTDTINKVVPPINISTVYFTLLISALAYFIKKIINGTKEDIKELKDKKVDSSICILREEFNQKLFSNINNNIQEIHEDQKELKEGLGEVNETLTNIRIFLNKGKWDGITERRSNAKGVVN